MTRLLAANALLCLLMTCSALAQPAPPTTATLRSALLTPGTPLTGTGFEVALRKRAQRAPLIDAPPGHEGCRVAVGSSRTQDQQTRPTHPDNAVFNQPPPASSFAIRAGSAQASVSSDVVGIESPLRAKEGTAEGNDATRSTSRVLFFAGRRTLQPAMTPNIYEQESNPRCGPAVPGTLFLKPGPNLSVSSQTTALHPETGLLAAALNDRPRDRWLGFDKVQHLTVSFLWTLGTQYTLVNKGLLRERRALPLSIGSSAVAGIGKEYYDLKRGKSHHFCRRDLVADAVGILLATGLILL